MLTAAQCEVVAFASENGEIFCTECAHNAMDEGEDVSGYSPWIAYVADEYQSERANELGIEDGLPEGCTEDCMPFALECENCGGEIVEAYHYGHTDDGGQEQEPPR